MRGIYVRRFFPAHSTIYGWCVYDRLRGSIPAYDACCTLLPLHHEPDGSATAVSPVLMDSEVKAVMLSSRLNAINRERIRKGLEVD